MADSYKMRYAISVVPTETLEDQNGGDHTVLSGEVGKSLGGNGEALVTNYTADKDVQGFLDATANYREAIDSADTTAISSESTASFVFIKNTGCEYSTASSLGDALTASIKVMYNTALISLLDAGECIVLKDDNAGIDCTKITVRTMTTTGEENSEIGHLAVEFLVVD